MNKYICFSLFIGLICYLSSCVEDPELSDEVRNATPPTVKLLTGIEEGYDLKKTATTITVQAEVESANGLPVERYGFCWNLDGNPTVENGDTIVCGTGLGIYEGVAKNLTADTTYHIRPYALNKKGVSYGDELAVMTNSGIGSIKTLEPWDIRATAVTCGGRMIERGEGEIEKSGIFLYKGSLKDPKPRFFSIEVAEKDSFFQVVSGLEASTTYYVLAYVENSFGVFPGGEAIQFETTDGKPYISSFELEKKDYTSATFKAVLSTSGDSEVTECGYCYSETNTNPTLEGENVINVPCELVSDSLFTGTLTDLKQQTVYYVRAYAQNSFGLTYSKGNAYELTAKSQAPTVTTSEITSADMKAGTISVKGEIKDIGESDVIDAGFCWSTNPNPTIANGKISAYQGDSIFTGVISGLKGSATYYIRSYATNSHATSYGETREISTPDIITTLAPYPGENVTEASSCLLGNYGYVFGGDLGSERSDILMAYNIVSDTWTDKAPAEIAVKGAAFFPLNALSILSLGGKDNQNEVTDAFYFYSLQANEWSPLEKGPALSYASGLAIDNMAYFIGGSAQDTISDKIYQFNADAFRPTWNVIGSFPEKQFGSVAVAIEKTIYVGLGRTGNGLSGASYSKHLWASDEDMLIWKEQADCPTEADGVISGIACNNILYVIDTNLDIWAFDPKSGEWTKQITSLRTELSSGNVNNLFMFASGGMIYVGITNGSKKFIKYDPAWDN